MKTLRFSTLVPVVVVGLVAVAALSVPVATAKNSKCQVINQGSGSYDSLQAAVDAASSNATLRVRGTCTGHTLISGKNLTLTGEQPPKGYSAPTLDGEGTRGSVVAIDIDATVTLNNLTITGGLNDVGGGIINIGSLTVNNSTVTGNHATFASVLGTGIGGGIWNGGTITLNNTSVTANTADIGGGGILNVGTATLTGTSTVTQNNLGGILNGGTLNGANGTNVHDNIGYDIA